jgi:hypothetical protein
VKCTVRWTSLERQEVYTIVIGKPVRKQSLGTPKVRSGGNIKMDLRELIVSCRGGRADELAEDLAQCLTFLLEVACLRVVEPVS